MLLLNTGLQFAVLAVFVVLVLVFMKLAALESRLAVIESNVGEFVVKDEFIEAINLLRTDGTFS